MNASAPIESIDQKYVLGKLLGVGGMGRVYAAVDLKKARVAVKLLHAGLANEPSMVARLGEEARAAIGDPIQ